MKRFVAVFAVFLTPFAYVDAQTLYRCQTDNKVTYSDRPCITGTEKRIQADGGPTPEQQAQARATLQRQLSEQEARTQAQSLQARTVRADAEARALAQGAQQSAKRQDQLDNEKHLVHTKSGWERLTKAQIADREKRMEANAAAAKASAGVANVNGQQQVLLNGVPMVSTGGGYIAPQTGTYYIDAGGGIINSQTGKFIPK